MNTWTPSQLVALCALFWSISGYAANATKLEIKIGGLFTDEDFDKLSQAAFTAAVDYVNSRDDLLPDVTLRTVTNVTSVEGGTFGLMRAACSLVQSSVGLVVGPTRSADVEAVSSIFSTLHIPHIAPFASDPSLSVTAGQYPYLYKMYIPGQYQSMVLEDLVRSFGWTKMSIIGMANNYGINELHHFQTNALKNNWAIRSLSYFTVAANLTAGDMRGLLLEVMDKGARVVILNCYAPYARLILDEAETLGMTKAGWAWVVMDGVTTMTGLFEDCSDVMQHLRGLVGIRPIADHGDLYDEYKRFMRNTTTLDGHEIATVSRAFDAVLATAYTLHDYLTDGHTYTAPQYSGHVCDQGGQIAPWSQGELIREYIDKVEGRGASSNIAFTDLQYSSAINYNIVNLDKNGWDEVGYWRYADGLGTLNINRTVYFTGNTDTVPKDTVLTLKDVHLRIVTILEEPYVHYAEGQLPNATNPVLAGYCIDLLDRLQANLGFTYSIYMVPDGTFGSKNLTTNQWNGIMGEMLSGAADLTVSSLTINYERQQYIDFTKPYQDLGSLLLMAYPTSTDDWLAFFGPFSWALWGAVGASFIGVGLVSSLASWWSPYGHRGRYSSRLNKNYDKYKDDRNAFNLWNSLWVSFSQWMMQGTEISPRSFSGRFIYGVWYFAIMVISATYTANLAAFLTVQRLDTGISSLEDLSRQTDIEYGMVKDTALYSFFKGQVSEPYVTMYKFMKERGNFLPNSSEAMHRVRKSYGASKSSQFVYIGESTTIEFEQSLAPCDIHAVGRVFNQVGYGLGLPKGSLYTELFSLEILKLRQSGTLQDLAKIWINSGECSLKDKNSGDGDTTQATLGNMAGVFCFLAGGTALALPLLLCECCVSARRDQRRHNALNKHNKISLGLACSRRSGAICTDNRRNLSVCLGGHDTDTDSEVDITSNWPTRHKAANGTLNGHHSPTRNNQGYKGPYIDAATPL